jgi:hypothetical protein
MAQGAWRTFLAWRNRDPAVIEALAALELRHLGLRSTGAST